MREFARDPHAALQIATGPLGDAVRAQPFGHEAAGVGACRLEHVELGRQLQRHPGQRGERLVEHDPACRQRQLQPVHGLEDLREHRAGIDVPHRLPAVALQHDRQLVGQLLFALARVAQPELAQPPREGLRVEVQDVDQQPDGGLAIALGQLADHAEVHQPDVIGPLDQDVGLVGVRVEEAVYEDHLHPGLGQASRELAAFVLGPVVKLELRERRALDALHDQHPRGRVPPEDHRDVDLRVVGEVAAERVRVVRFDAVVELAPDRPRELIDQGDQVDERQAVDAVLEQAGELVQQLDVGVDLALGVGALHLDDHLVPAGQPCPMDLADRGRGDGLLVELGEDLFDAQPELGLDDPPDIGERLGPGTVLQLAQFLNDVGRNDVRPRRHQLPELDEGGPQLVEHVPEPSAPRPGNLRGVGGRLGGRPAEQLPEAVARGDLGNLTDAREVLAPL